MSGEAIFWLAFYGAFAALSVWGTAHDRDLLWLGFWLTANYLVSNALWFLGVGAHDRPGIYTLFEVIIALGAYVAWSKYRSRALPLILALNILSIAANIAFAAIVAPTYRQIHVWEVTANVCFALECLLAFGVGVSHGRRIGRFDHWPFSGWRAAQPHVARAEGDQP